MTKDEKRKTKYDRMMKYLATNHDFLSGGTIELEIEKVRYKRMGLTSPIYSLGSQPRVDHDVPFGYSCDPMADSIDTLLSRIIIW